MRLFLECFPDETLAIALGVSTRAIIHSHSKGRVSKALGRHSGAIGLVDQDPGEHEPAGLHSFVEAAHQHDVVLRIDRSRDNRLLVLCPRLEPWLIKTSKAAGVRMADFNLSDRLQDLDAEINFRLPNLDRLVRRLLDLRSPRISHLKSLLTS